MASTSPMITIECEDNVTGLLTEATKLVNRLGELGISSGDITTCPSDLLIVNDRRSAAAATHDVLVSLEPSQLLLDFVAALRAIKSKFDVVD